jgi:hypothetical protein
VQTRDRGRREGLGMVGGLLCGVVLKGGLVDEDSLSSELKPTVARSRQAGFGGGETIEVTQASCDGLSFSSSSLVLRILARVVSVDLGMRPQ